MSVSCDDECGFRVQSNDKEELSSILKKHAMDKHSILMEDEEVEEKITMVMG